MYTPSQTVDCVLSCDRHDVDQPTLENGDYYLHPDDESEPEPIRIKEPPRHFFFPFGLNGIDYDSDEFDDYGNPYDSSEDDFYYGHSDPFDYDNPYAFDDDYF